MDFADEIRELGKQVEERIKSIETEEATKNALILPFIRCLGFDVFDPTEVVPEFTADLGNKKGEKVDYAIFKDSAPILLFECKPCRVKLNVDHATQLQRYFHCVTAAKFGILSNGINYQFYSDLDEQNVMDRKPFLEVVMLDLTDALIAELKRFSRSTFDKSAILSTAGQLKYTKELRIFLEKEFADPEEDLVKFLASKVYDGRMTQHMVVRFSPIVKKALQQVIDAKINQTLDRAKALQDEVAASPKVELEEEGFAVAEEGDGIETTSEEWEGYYIVKAILAADIPTERIALRDRKSYCGILLDDNNRKPICRLHFNSPKRKCLGLFDGEQKDDRVEISNVRDIYGFADRLRATVQAYDEAKLSCVEGAPE